MPYVTKVERERREWLTLAEAVEYVAAAEGISDALPSEQLSVSSGPEMSVTTSLGQVIDQASTLESVALKQIRLALQDHEIPVRWARETWPREKSFSPGAIFANDEPPPGGLFWQHTIVFPLENYAVLDRLFFLDSVMGMGLEDQEKANKRQLLLLRSRVHQLWPSTERIETEAILKKEKPTSEQIRQVAREVYGTTEPPPNINKAQQLIREKLPNATRVLMKPVLKEPEFVRRDSGNPKKPY